MARCWTQELIDATVTLDFIYSHLQPHEQHLLYHHVSFGAGLTNDSYLDWILSKAKRLFLILVEIGAPDRIISLIDASYDDSDLPIPVDKVYTMPLSVNAADATLNREFYTAQHDYLVRELKQGCHMKYLPEETVPGEVIQESPTAFLNDLWNEKVIMPGAIRKVYTRLRVPLNEAPAHVTEHELLADIEAMRAHHHEHILSVWSSYSIDGCGYVLLEPAVETTLKAFVYDPPQYFMNLPLQRQRELLINWPHCLANGLLSIHRMGRSHGAIRPSNILIDSHFRIVLGPLNKARTLQVPNVNGDTEAYDYAAPEQFSSDFDGAPYPLETEEPDSNVGSCYSSYSGGPSPIENAMASGLENLGPLSPVSDESDLSSSLGSVSDDFDATLSPATRTHASSFSSWTSNRECESLPADIFSLGAVVLDILTHLFDRKPWTFATHRSTSPMKRKPKTVPIPVLLPPVARNVANIEDPSTLDSSFHANLPQLVTWMDSLDDAACAKDDQIFRGIPPILALLSCMLAKNPSRRPSATEVEDRLDDALFRFAHIPDLHCGKSHYAPTPSVGVPMSSSSDDEYDDLEFEGLESEYGGNSKVYPRYESRLSYPSLGSFDREQQLRDTRRFTFASDMLLSSRMTNMP